jgi:hypothetical protein
MRSEERNKRDTPALGWRVAGKRRNANMTVPTTPPAVPPDREEIVEVVNQPGAYRQRRIVRSTTLEQHLILTRITQVLWTLFGFLEALIGIRIVLKLIGANFGAFFTQVIYGITDIFLWPFAGITPDPGVGAFQLEISSIIGVIVYGLIAWGLIRLIWVLFYHPETAVATAYREERY